MRIPSRISLCSFIRYSDVETPRFCLNNALGVCGGEETSDDADASMAMLMSLTSDSFSVIRAVQLATSMRNSSAARIRAVYEYGSSIVGSDVIVLLVL